MLTEDEYMDVLALRRQGLTIAEIATETGYHPATISKWLEQPNGISLARPWRRSRDALPTAVGKG